MDDLKLDIWTEVLITIYNNEDITSTKLAAVTKFTNSHISKIIHILQNKQIIEIIKVGREIHMKTTAKGSLIVMNLIEIKKYIHNV